MTVVVRVENVSKKYQLGAIGTQSLKGDFNRWWAKVRGKEDPFAKIGDESQHHNGEFWALKDINFEVRQGDAVGIIGKNGAGKSTLLKILSRITNPTTGNVKIKGRIASLLEVGTGFNPDLSGRDNIFLNGAILGMTKQEIKAKFDEIVDFSGIEKFIDTPVKRYSSGMYVRLAFAVAAHLESEILILDEVLAVGDSEFQKKCLGKMDDVTHKQGRTILFVSHSMAAIQNLCTQAIMLTKGQIAASGATESVIVKYLEINRTGVNENLNIGQRKDRNGNGNVIIQDIKFYDFDTQKEIELLIAGHNVLVEVTYAAKDQTSVIQNFNLGLAFFNKNEQFVTVLNSQMANNHFRSLPPVGKVYCHIPKLPLMSGNYHLTVTLQTDGILTDQVIKAKTVMVEMGDYYGTGKPNDYNRQGVYVEHEWLNNLNEYSVGQSIYNFKNTS